MLEAVRLRITFHGAARQVTGSSHLLEIGGRRILLDCGLFDADRVDPESPNRKWTFDPRELDAVIVSHAHNDHIGRLPCLTRAGYRGPIYVTPATGDITSVMLRDSARIQREDVRNGSVRDANDQPIEPLFEVTDVEWLVEQFNRVPYNQPTEILPGITLTYKDAGHILGSALIQLDFREGSTDRRFVFTGDLGRRDMGLLPDPSTVQDIDILVTESTYGNRLTPTKS
jgi:metallo-beta-lactamase family protein